MTAPTDALRQGFRELGYIEGKHFIIEFRSGERNRDRRSALAAELVRLKVDVIVSAWSDGNPRFEGRHFHDSDRHGS